MSITIAKSYELLNISHNPKFRVYGGDLKTLFYEIIDNSGLSGYYPSKLFYTIEEMRDMKLNQILQKENFL
jgi:hypothetical protein